MNLLYLIIIAPLFSFLLLTAIGRHIRSNHVVVIGIGSSLVISIITIFICIDYSVNSVPDMTLSYSRFLWDWFTVGGINVPITLVLDGLSLTLMILIVFFSTIIYFFARMYLTTEEDTLTFYCYGNLLIASMLTLILVDNLLVMLIGWEGVTISSYLLVGIYYKRLCNSYSAMKTFIIMHLPDLFFVLAIFMLYSELGTLNIRDILTYAHDNLAIDSDFIFWTTLALFLAVMGKAALFPLHTWFTESTLAPMPVVALLQSSTVIISGIYLVLRLSNLFVMSTDVQNFMAIAASINLIFTSTVSLVLQDIKRIVTYINLSQISYLFLAFATQNWDLSLSFLINYAMTSALLILSSSMLIKMCNGERDLRKFGGLFKQTRSLYLFFIFIAVSISAIPKISFSFYVKGDIIWGLMTQNKLGSGTIGLLGILLSTISIVRLILLVFHNRSKNYTLSKIKPIKYAFLFMLALFTTAMFIYFSLPIEGLIPISNLDTNGQLLFQLLLTAVTLLGFLIGYIIYAYPNSEIREIAHTPIAKLFVRLAVSEWRIEYLWKQTFVKLYLSFANLTKKDPLAAWDAWIVWGIKKINGLLTTLENGQLRWYTVSIIVGSIIILMLLIFI